MAKHLETYFFLFEGFTQLEGFALKDAINALALPPAPPEI
jgi:hypothetical protein